MMHYSIDEWYQFKTGTLNSDDIEKMQTHLLECSDCMDLYLSTIDEQDELNAFESLPADFADTLMDRIKLEDSRINTTKKRTYFTNIMIYYVSAACVTLLLMSNGVFRSLFNNMPGNSSIIKNNISKSESFLTNGWTDQLANKTSLFIDELLNKNRGDSFEK